MTTVICIDPGHGGDLNGESHVYNEKPVYEKNFNLDIAQFIEAELRKYDGIEVILTRHDDVNLNFKQRIKFAVDNKADYFISIHANFLDDPKEKRTGSMILVPATHYQPEKSRVPDIYGIGNQLGLSILSKLKTLGVPICKGNENGLIRRIYKHKKGERCDNYYNDGSAADKFPIMKQAIEVGIPAIIINHAYMSTEEDYKAYLSEWKFLEKLAKADADGIVEALHLREKPEKTQPNVFTYH